MLFATLPLLRFHLFSMRLCYAAADADARQRC